MATFIRSDNVSKSFRLAGQPILVVDQVSVSVRGGEFVSLLGPSGCGKSTLLALLAAMYAPDSGSIERAGRISLLMQDDMLLPWRDVLDNAVLPLELRGAPAQQLAAARRQAERYLPLFGLEGFGGSLPAQLSGGMRQRAALLRTVTDGGDIWLLDEPFGKLDALTKEELQDWLRGLLAQFDPGVLLVTHDIDEALRLSDRIYLMSSRPGRIIGELKVAADEDEQRRLRQQIKRLLLEDKRNAPEQGAAADALE
ncbi:MAG: ATP-binding cassette domain-containing protein [Bacillota bacterium]|nr:ATP-binding cassette domain-containing protein [Bacillota bacterium]